MVVLERRLIVNRSIDDCFAYLADFRNAAEWDSTTISAEKLTAGPPQVGSEYALNLRFLLQPFKMHYRIVELEPPTRIVLEATGSTSDALDIITLTTTANGCEILYHAELDLKGGNETLARPFLNRMADKTIAGIHRALEPDHSAPTISASNRIADTLVLPGMWNFTSRGYLKGRKNWRPLSERLDNKTVLVSGCTSGLGLAAATEMARLGADLILLGRNADKLQQVAKDIAQETGITIPRYYCADLSLAADCQRVAAEICAAETRLDVLLNNAGALYNDRSLTSEGNERSFAINLLGHVLLTEALKPLLGKGSRVINMVSGGMYTQPLVLSDLQYERGKYDGAKAYARAKRGMVAISQLWAKRWADEGIIVHAMHPGWADTPGVVTALPEFHEKTRKRLRSPEQGADTAVWLAASSAAGNCSGLFWLDREPHQTEVLPKTAVSPAKAEALHERLMTMGTGT